MTDTLARDPESSYNNIVTQELWMSYNRVRWNVGRSEAYPRIQSSIGIDMEKKRSGANIADCVHGPSAGSLAADSLAGHEDAPLTITSPVRCAGKWFRDTSELLECFDAMGPVESDRAVALLEAMVARNGVREAAVAFLEARGVGNPGVVADRILNDAEGEA